MRKLKHANNSQCVVDTYSDNARTGIAYDYIQTLNNKDNIKNQSKKGTEQYLTV